MGDINIGTASTRRLPLSMVIVVGGSTAARTEAGGYVKPATEPHASQIILSALSPVESLGSPKVGIVLV